MKEKVSIMFGNGSTGGKKLWLCDGKGLGMKGQKDWGITVAIQRLQWEASLSPEKTYYRKPQLSLDLQAWVFSHLRIQSTSLAILKMMLLTFGF